MDLHPLDESIAATLREVDELASRDRAGQTYAEVQARMGYLHTLLQSLEHELAGLRQDAVSASAETLWRQTVNDVRAKEPDCLRAPAAALMAGNLDLLRLVEYTSASIALVQERRSVLRRMYSPESEM